MSGTTGVPMQEMIESLTATIEMAARQGISRARIDLEPDDLGHISIRLSQTAEGLRARVTADTPAGQQALTQGRSELRQSLSSLGLSLLRLDIGSSDQSQTRDQSSQRFAGNRGGSNPSSATVVPGEELDELDVAPSRPSGGALGEIVDVLA